MYAKHYSIYSIKEESKLKVCNTQHLHPKMSVHDNHFSYYGQKHQEVNLFKKFSNSNNLISPILRSLNYGIHINDAILHQAYPLKLDFVAADVN